MTRGSAFVHMKSSDEEAHFTFFRKKDKAYDEERILFALLFFTKLIFALLIMQMKFKNANLNLQHMQYALSNEALISNDVVLRTKN